MNIEHILQVAANAWDKLSEEEKYKVQVVPLELVLAQLQELRKRSVIWSVEDFESRAIHQLDLGDDDETWKEKYDETKFDEALMQMIHDHDCNYGITWNHIDEYLDQYCKK